VVVALLGFTVEGARFIFGDLVYNNVPVGHRGGRHKRTHPGDALQVARTGASFAFNVLPTIIFFSSLMTVLYHLGVMQWIVKGMAWVMQKTLGDLRCRDPFGGGQHLRGPDGGSPHDQALRREDDPFGAACGHDGGFATVAGGVLAAYVGMLVAYFPDIAGHLIAASVMSAPAALVMAKLMYPETGCPLPREACGSTWSVPT
jgi:concentrative nucleoside transporter, CNT family